MSKTGLARISGGDYKIDDSEGRAIASFVPPLLLKNLEWESLSRNQEWLFGEFAAHWEIIAHWLVYYRTKAVDIRQMPFTDPEFFDKRPIAELYNSRLELCAAVWEAIDIRSYYPTPYDWWRDCMLELQEEQKEFILCGGEIEIITLTKGQTEDGLRKLRRSLKDKIPFKETSKNKHLYRLYNASIEFKDLGKIRQRWAEYLKQLGLLAGAMKSNSGIKALVHLKNGLFYREGNTLVPIPILKDTGSIKDAVLDIRAKFALLNK